MGLGNFIKRRQYEVAKRKARGEASIYGIDPEKSDRFFDTSRKEEYIYRQRKEYDHARDRIEQEAKKGPLSERFKRFVGENARRGVKSYIKNRKKTSQSSRYGNSQRSPGPQFGLSNPGSIEYGLSRKKGKGPFDL